MFDGIKNMVRAVKEAVKITKIDLPESNRMGRIGVGRHEGVWYARVDLWIVGYRLERADIYLIHERG